MSTHDNGRIVLVVHQPGNAKVLGQAVAEIGMTAVTAASKSVLKTRLAEPDAARAALVDVSGFGSQVWPLCSLLHDHDIPFVVMSPARDQEASTRSVQYGASTVLQKPIAKEALLNLLKSLSGRPV